MENQKVIELYYRIETVKGIYFDSPPPIEGQTDSFHFSLSDGKLVIKLDRHYSNVEEAQRLVEDFLRSWELDDAVRNRGKRIKFVFDDAKIIYPNNPNNIIICSPGVFSVEGGSLNMIMGYPCYPNPPVLFKISPDLITMWQRYEGFLKNREPLQSMAYACLTFLISCAGNFKNTEQKFKIDIKVLKKLGELTAETRGDKKNIRKFKSGVSPRPLSSIENEWIIAALMAIIRRVGEINNVASLPIITMNDLPKLP